MIFYKVGPRQTAGAHSPVRSLRRTTGRIEVVRLPPPTSLWGYGESLRSRAILVVISGCRVHAECNGDLDESPDGRDALDSAASRLNVLARLRHLATGSQQRRLRGPHDAPWRQQTG